MTGALIYDAVAEIEMELLHRAFEVDGAQEGAAYLHETASTH